jgi:hypothetical protein
MGKTILSGKNSIFLYKLLLRKEELPGRGMAGNAFFHIFKI